MELKLFDSERKVMEVLWDHGDLSAKELADRLKELVGWSKTTTYTVIKKCIDKKAASVPGVFHKENPAPNSSDRIGMESI